MKKPLLYSLWLLLVFCFWGCSFRSMYIIRNSLKEPAAVILSIKRVEDSVRAGTWQIASVGKIVPLEKSKLANAFINTITGTWDESGTCKFEVPAGWSVDITSLLEQLNPERDASADFYGSTLEIKYAKSALLFGNNRAEVQRIFKLKSFFWGGPVVYYLDLE